MLLRQRRYLSLMEVLVALTLFSIILTFLLGTYLSFNHLNRSQEILHEKAIQNRYMKTRLQRMFSSLMPNDESAAFLTLHYNNSPSLVFTYHNGVNINPRACNMVLAGLFVQRENEKKHLCLAVWEKPEDLKRSPILRQEVLMKDIEKLHFTFIDEENERSTWSDKSRIPTLIAIHVDKQKKRQDFLFNTNTYDLEDK